MSNSFRQAQQVQSKYAARSKLTAKYGKTVSKGEAMLCQQLNVMNIEFTQEFRFNPDRRWKADFRIDDYPILVEVEGGVHCNGRHTRGEGYTADCEKYSVAAAMGWFVIRGTTKQVQSGLVLKWIEDAMKRLEAA
ncbi:very-short-patch-repair endonuclease [Acinetobacter baylyi]|uniref:Very-short-patch-repair endonuclease n=1 Tax=Acinetobacter baylyi TaxID=202950 RepID=A0ABU0USH9_ACIBI|nr:hypothetical protein [Acinetobacter baylyi]MDQ1207253.1 very-short-patch-repair endonuclease [Acinetobacter baylyi]MDR6105666.1 very-short-patch-repair endonuclease [Acinetobacter baylyi]MDR6187614.1 very-short-patch-repair endonuclease [Acinetobacter baylyi]